jgi:hypothetical protein
MAMASRGRGRGQAGGRIGAGGGCDHIVYRPVAETPAKRWARIVCSEAAKECVVRRYTNHGARTPPQLTPYAAYATGASSSQRRPCSPTPPPSSSTSSDDADSGRVIGPKDFVKEPAEEERALAKTAAEVAAQQTAEKAERLAALRTVEAFQEREAARAQRLADRLAEAAAFSWGGGGGGGGGRRGGAGGGGRGGFPPPPPPPAAASTRSSAPPVVGRHRQALVSSLGAEFCVV